MTLPGSSSTANSQGVTLTGEDLTLAELVRVARSGAKTSISDDPEIRGRIEASLQHVLESARAAEPVYGITTGFGGMANVGIAPEQAAELQANLLRFTTVGAGDFLPREDIRAAMVLRANSHVRGVSGLRPEIIERMARFLNADAVPRVREFGSIGASGDLCPLAQIMGAICGLSDHYTVDMAGEIVDCLTVLERLDLEPLLPGPKEGLAMINGTSVMTATAALCVHDANRLVAAAIGLHALYIQALRGTNQSFHPFVHAHKPHPGQVLAADLMLGLLDGSQLSRDELDGSHEERGGAEPIQDRYSLRCLPQFLGPVLDGLSTVRGQIEIEMNCANDNPLIDPETGASYHAGNFLGQYVGVGMDQVRQLIGLTAKHVDTQIALLMAPEFSNGLPASLVGNPDRRVNMGMKGLQISANSIMPLLTWFGHPLADRFPTHAEQFNQNINSQGFGSANLTRQAMATARQYFAISMLVAVQAVDMRTFERSGHYDARRSLSPSSVPLYEAVRKVVDKPPSEQRPYRWNDNDQFLDDHIARVAEDLGREDGLIATALEPIHQRL